MKKVAYFSIFIFIVIILDTYTSHKPSNDVRVGLVQWIGYAPLYVAEHDKTLPKNLRIIDYNSNYDILEDIKSGRLDAAFLTLDEVHTLRKEGLRLKVIYAIDTSNGADALLANKSIANIKELKNKRVAYEPKTVQEYLLFRALEKNNMKMRDIQVVLCKLDEQFDLRKKNLFDAIVTFEPVKSKLLKNDLHILFSSRDIPYEIVDLFVVREAVLKEDKETFVKILQALATATKKIKKDTTTDSVVAEYLNMTAQKVRNAYDDIILLSKEENLQLLNSDRPILLNTIEHIHRYSPAGHKNDKHPKDLIDGSFLKEVY